MINRNFLNAVTECHLRFIYRLEQGEAFIRSKRTPDEDIALAITALIMIVEHCREKYGFEYEKSEQVKAYEAQALSGSELDVDTVMAILGLIISSLVDISFQLQFDPWETKSLFLDIAKDLGLKDADAEELYQLGILYSITSIQGRENNG